MKVAVCFLFVSYFESGPLFVWSTPQVEWCFGQLGGNPVQVLLSWPDRTCKELLIAAGEAFSTRIPSVAWVCERLRDLLWALLSASLKRLLVRKVISRIPIEYALQIARRKRGAVGICARGYAPQRTFVFKDQRATYVRGDAPFIAQRSGG